MGVLPAVFLPDPGTGLAKGLVSCYITDYLTRYKPMSKQAELSRTKARKTRLPGGRWKLEDAKARFSEVVRHAREQGPQRVSVRGHDAVVVMSVEEFERLAPEKPRAPFVQFMESLYLGDLDLDREPDHGRDVEL